MLKNVIVINDFDYVQGGASKVAIQTANMISKSNKDVKVYFFSAVHSDESILNNEVIRININQDEAMREKNKVKGFINGIYNYKAKKELKKLLLSLNKEETIIHIHGWTKALSSSVFDIAFKMKFKVILTLHDYFTACPNGGYFNYRENKICHLKPLSWKCVKCNCDSRNYLFKVYRIIRQFVQNRIVKLNERLTNVITISDFSEKILKETLSKNTIISKIENPIDFDKNIINKDFKNNEYYINVSRLSKEKNVELFCEAIKRTHKKGIVVGDGPLLKTLEDKYPMIEFVGWKNSDEVKKIMCNGRYLVFTTNLYEGAPLTTREALMMGLPCIIWSGCAAKDQIVENKNGFLYNDIKDLVEIINNKEINEFKYEYDNNYIYDLIKTYNKILGEEG